jgi:uncharacterized membrane protein
MQIELSTPYKYLGTTMLLKALSWETWSTLFILLLAWLFFGHLEMCILFSVIAFILKVGLYVVHEHLWNHFFKGNNK